MTALLERPIQARTKQRGGIAVALVGIAIAATIGLAGGAWTQDQHPQPLIVHGVVSR